MGRIKLNRSKEELLEMQRIRQNRYYQAHRERLNAEAKKRYWVWTKKCPSCGRTMSYTSESNLSQAAKRNLVCKSCSQLRLPYEWIYNSLVNKCKEREISLALTYDQFVEFTKIPLCHYCHDNLIWTSHQKFKARQKCRYNLDRKDNTRGYSPENCCVCCPDCNSIKSDRFSYAEMVKIGKILQEIKKERKCLPK